MTNLTETKGKKYTLVGFITKNYENEKYNSYCEFRKTKKWFKCEDKNLKAINQDEFNIVLNDNKGPNNNLSILSTSDLNIISMINVKQRHILNPIIENL